MGKAKAKASAAGQARAAAQQQLDELVEFINRERIVTIPEGAPVDRRPDAAVLSLDVRQHVDAGSVRSRAAARVLLHHRRRSVVAGGAAGTSTCATSTTARSGRSRSTRSSRPLPPLPAPPAGRVEAAQVDPVLVGGLRRRLGALLRADDGRRGFRRNDPASARTARRGADPPVPLRRRHPAALRGHVGRAGGAVLPRRSVPRGAERAPRGRARHVRSVLRRLLRSAS